MKLKPFFESLARNGQKVEIYYRDDDFGFKINDIDSGELYEKFELGDIFVLIIDDIREAFLESELIENGEGDTSYFLQADLSCVKTAKYFDWVTETEEYWITKNNTEFNFGKIELPIDRILINKDSNNFEIREEKELRKYISAELLKDFSSFYELLLDEFQEMEIELELSLNENNNVISSILQMNGAYQEIIKFVFLDSSNLDIPIDYLKSILIKYFKFDTKKADYILS